MNEVSFIMMVIISLGSIYFLNKFWKMNGLYIWIIIAFGLSFLLSFKIGLVFNFNMFLNIPVYLSLLLSFYLILEQNAKIDIKKIVFGLLFVFLVIIIYLLFMINYVPSIGDLISNNFSFLIKSNLANFYLFFVLVISDLLLIKFLYFKLKDYYENIFISYFLTIILSQAIHALLTLGILFFNGSENALNVVLDSYIYTLIIAYIYFLFFKLMNKPKVKK